MFKSIPHVLILATLACCTNSVPASSDRDAFCPPFIVTDLGPLLDAGDGGLPLGVVVRYGGQGLAADGAPTGIVTLTNGWLGYVLRVTTTERRSLPVQSPST